MADYSQQAPQLSKVSISHSQPQSMRRNVLGIECFQRYEVVDFRNIFVVLNGFPMVLLY